MSAAVSEAVELDAAILWLQTEAENLEREGAKTYGGNTVAAALANSGARLDRKRAAYYRTILAALQEGSGALPASPDVFELAGALENTGVAIGVSTWPDEQRRDAVILAEAAINALGPWLSGTAPDAPQAGMEPRSEK